MVEVGRLFIARLVAFDHQVVFRLANHCGGGRPRDIGNHGPLSLEDTGCAGRVGVDGDFLAGALENRGTAGDSDDRRNRYERFPHRLPPVLGKTNAAVRASRANADAAPSREVPAGSAWFRSPPAAAPQGRRARYRRVRRWASGYRPDL